MLNLRTQVLSLRTDRFNFQFAYGMECRVSASAPRDSRRLCRSLGARSSLQAHTMTEGVFASLPPIASGCLLAHDVHVASVQTDHVFFATSHALVVPLKTQWLLRLAQTHSDNDGPFSVPRDLVMYVICFSDTDHTTARINQTPPQSIPLTQIEGTAPGEISPHQPE